jgi:hypothetical protein
MSTPTIVACGSYHCGTAAVKSLATVLIRFSNWNFLLPESGKLFFKADSISAGMKYYRFRLNASITDWNNEQKPVYYKAALSITGRITLDTRLYKGFFQHRVYVNVKSFGNSTMKNIRFSLRFFIKPSPLSDFRAHDCDNKSIIGTFWTNVVIIKHSITVECHTCSQS